MLSLFGEVYPRALHAAAQRRSAPAGARSPMVEA
jgi:hypothetical protein